MLRTSLHNSIREHIWGGLTFEDYRGILVIGPVLDQFEDPTTQFTFLDKADYRTQSWKWLPRKWLRFWLRIGVIQVDESYEIERALGVTRWKNAILYTATEKGRTLYARRQNTVRRYL